MKNRFGHKICKNCKKVFVENSQKPSDFCEFMCEATFKKLELSDSKVKTFICITCEKSFFNRLKKRFCSEICKVEFKKSRCRLSEEQKILNANHRFFNPEIQNKKKISYEVLNQIAEKNRVMDEAFAYNYIRGNTRDKI